MRIKSIHPGVNINEIIDNTGFDVIIPDKLETTMTPTELEIQILRTRIDPKGVLRREIEQ